MKASLILGLAILIAATLAAALPTCAGELFHRGRNAPAWNTNYYDSAWGMPEALVVPPTVHWQSNYAWGVGGTRLTRVRRPISGRGSGPRIDLQPARLSAHSAPAQRHAAVRRELRPRPATIGTGTSAVNRG